MKSVAARFAGGHAGRLNGKPLPARVEEAATILEERGNIVTWVAEEGEYAIAKHTCPYWNVATKNSIVCALDVEYVRQLVGQDMRLTTSLLRGDDCCTFRVRSDTEQQTANNKQIHSGYYQLSDL